MSYSKLNHRIGGNSSYDGDMDLIESFVKYVEDPNDLFLAYEIKSYYISRALYYWRMLKEYFTQKEILEGAHIDDYIYVTDPIIEKIFFERLNQRINLYPEFFKSLDKRYTKYSSKKLFEKIKNSITDTYVKYGRSEPFYEKIFGNNTENKYSNYEDLLNDYAPLSEDYLTPSEKKELGRKATLEELKYNSMYYNHMRLNYILENMTKYEEEFLQMIRNIQNHEGPFNNESFIELFAYIGKLNCLYLNNEAPSTYEDYKKLEVNKIFLIVNGNGAFSLNTWLYSYFEGIELLGFTSKRAEYDSNSGCSLDMFEHDIGHISEAIKFKKYGKTFHTLKNIYYNIINSTFTKEKKELFVFVLWAFIHEFMDKINFSMPLQYNVGVFMNFTYEDAGAGAVYSEFRKFSDLLLLQDNIDHTLELFKNLKFGSKYIQKIYVNDFIDFENNLNPENRDKLSDLQYALLGLVYVFEEIELII